MPDTRPPERDPETVTRVKRDAAQRLLAIPDVVAVGIGQKVTGGQHTGEPAIKVFVREKRPLAEVEIGGDPIPILEPVNMPGVFELSAQTQDHKTYRPVVGGGRIITHGSCTGGTGGCLLWDKQNHDVGYVLT